MKQFLEKHGRQFSFIICSGLIALGVLAAGIIDLKLGSTLVTKGAYYVILIMSGFWIFNTLPFFRDALRGKIKQLILCLIMTIIVFVSIPPKYRVLSDETNLLSVSQSMTYRRDISNVTQAKFYYGNFNVLQGDLPTRPLLFPFLTSIIHTVSGYRFQNVFALNFIILFAMLSMTFLAVAPILGELSAMAACLLLLSIPTLTLSASSGGFDVCSLFFFGLSFVLLYRFLIFQSPERFATLFIQLIMLAQIRYESIAYVAIILGTLFFLKKITPEMISKNKVMFAASPFFIIPMLLQRKLTPNTYENPPGVPPFAFDHFIKHSKLLIENMIYSKPDFPYPTYLNWLSVILLVVLLVKVGPKLKSKLDENQRVLVGLIVGTVTVSLVIVLCHHFGVFPHPTQARLFLVFLTFLALIPVAFRYFFPNLLTEKRLFTIAVVCFALYHPIATQGRFTNSLTIIRETEDLYQFLAETNDHKILIIAERPGQFTVANYGAVGFGFANGNRGSLIGDLNRGLISNIWVFQKISFETGKPLDDQNLEPDYQLETIKEFMVTASEFIRISKIKRPFYPIQPEKVQSSVTPTPKLNKELNQIFENVKFK